MTSKSLEVVELLGHRDRSHCRPGAEAGKWDTGAGANVRQTYPRLEDSLATLGSGRRDASDRQRTLKGAIAWRLAPEWIAERAESRPARRATQEHKPAAVLRRLQRQEQPSDVTEHPGPGRHGGHHRASRATDGG
jgi:hypothetical protein